MDRYYFTRNQNDLRICTDSSHIDKDPLYSTGYDFKVAKIITNELLKIYLTNRLQELERIVQRKADNGQVVETILRWTGSKRALVELIYALEANGDFNKGTATLKEIAGYFENVFSIDIGDLYHSYLEMRSRKINRTRYLETLIGRGTPSGKGRDHPSRRAKKSLVRECLSFIGNTTSE